jgi:glycosyltransferase involved in cell wall biosynthesis
VQIGIVYQHTLGPGGYPRDVRWLAGALARHGHRVLVAAGPGPERDGLGDAEVVSPRAFESVSAELDVLHVWGVFLPAQLALARRCRGGSALVVSPIAHLMEHHMRRRQWKKVPYMLVLGRAIARRRPTVHLFSAAERSGASRYLRPQSWFEATLGIFPPPGADVAPGDPGEYLLFFGRNDVHHKGIDVLLAGYAASRHAGLGLPLTIAGRPHGHSRELIRDAVSRLGLDGAVRIVEEPDEPEKWRLLRGARAQVFLSRWDGPPRPVREALAVGTPTVVSIETNMAAVVEAAGAGRSVTLDPAVVAQALREAEDGELVARWRNGARRLRERLSWDAVALDYVRGYEVACAAR